MSDPLRVAMAVEGPTDEIVLRAAIKSLLPNRALSFTLLQPEFSLAFSHWGGKTGLGWSGVYHWCRQTADEGGGRVSTASLFNFHDLLVAQVDADVAGMTYQSGNIDDKTKDLPCEKPCPPPSDTTDALRSVILRWMGETRTPDRVVLCTPSKSLETWVMATLFPRNQVLARHHWECYAIPEAQLRQQPKSKRIRKCTEDYQAKRPQFHDEWPRVSKKLTEADRFSKEFLAVVNSIL